jgi:capsular polysaccharide biosynthesis protein
VTTPAPPSRGFDPEAEQEVDFARYVRLLGARWWLLVAGLVVGAVIGYLISLGGTQVYSASSTVYLGQPYSVGGNTLLFGLQTQPSAVGQVIHSQLVDSLVAQNCKTTASQFRKGISSKAAGGGSGSSSSSTSTKTGQSPLVTISVQTKHAKLAECAANQLSAQVVKRLGTYPQGKIANLKAEIAADKAAIAAIQGAATSSSISTTDKLLLETQLRTNQLDEITANQLLLQATQVEAPRLVSAAAAQKITARSRRNTVVIAALIGLIIGAIVALLWEPVAGRVAPRNGV